MLESYVNLDFRYDKNRGASNNVALSPQNFNLFNDSAYNQSGNFFSYHQLDYTLIKDNNFPNTITWSLEKHLGEDVDSWMSIDVSNTEELDGTFGKVNKVVNYNNELYCFQDTGISQLLFNSRVQIPTSDGVPIEITNGMKMQGKRYISTKIGCINKWSIVETPMGVYFNDDILKATYMFNGQLADLSTTKGMKSWMNMTCNNKVWNPEDFINCKAFYDKVGRDIYWIYGNTALVYSEILGQYMSFMDYGNVPLLTSLCNSTYAITGLTSNTTYKI
jgi:cell wall assembly regulator SMI1